VGDDDLPDLPQTLVDLVDQVLTFSFVMAIICTTQVAVLVYWKYRANRSYYEHSASQTSIASLLSGSGAKTSAPKFRALPAVLVFPNLISMAIGIFVTGLSGTAVSLLADVDADEICAPTPITCKWPALLILAGVRAQFRFRVKSRVRVEVGV
tara:strand:+ start:157 stop:615 length:459 start_codon:yes stop_codon:yes gene_type:complete